MNPSERGQLKDVLGQTSTSFVVIFPGQTVGLRSEGFPIEPRWEIMGRDLFLAIPVQEALRLIQDGDINVSNQLAQACYDSMLQISSPSQELDEYMRAILSRDVYKASSYYPSANVIPGLVGLLDAYYQQQPTLSPEWQKISEYIQQQYDPEYVKSTIARANALNGQLQRMR